MKRLDASVISSAHGAPYYGSSTCRSTKSRRLVVNLKAAGGHSIWMHKLDRLVTDHLMKRR
jgi:hypothetical protein